MRETKFIEQNQEKWADFEQMLKESRHDPEKLNDLFIQITDDLSYARTYYPNRSVRMFLNSLAQRIFHNVYRGKRFPVGRLRRFWTDELPRLFWEERRSLLLSFCIFALAFGIGLVSSIIDPDFARVILGDGYVDMTLQNIQNGDPMAVYKESKPMGMTLGIAFNNLRVALFTAIFGVLASLGTVFILLYNGVMVGAFQYFFIEKGLFWESFLSIWIHGTLEISTIIIAGAAGLVAGSGLLFPGTYRRSQAFQLSMRRALKIFLGIAPLVILAAIFEGFFTRYTATPDIVRGLFILSSLAFVLWYFVWLPWHRAKSGSFNTPVQEKELPPDVVQAIDFGAIKTSGEILADAFAALLRRARSLMLWGIVSASGLFLALVFWLSPQKLADTFNFSSDILGVFKVSVDFFRNEPVPYLFYLQLLILAALGLMALIALREEMPENEKPAVSVLQLMWSALAMTLPAAGFICFLRIEPGFFGWFFAMAAYPFLSLWCAVLFFETSNPFTSLGRAFNLMPWLPGIVTGILTVNLNLLLFWFLDSPVWEMILQLFSWLVPPGADNMRTFHAIVNIVVASMLLYFNYLLNIICGGLLYFSSREIKDAVTLREGIETVGMSRQIRGLARE